MKEIPDPDQKVRKLRNNQQRGLHAQELIDDWLLKEALEQIRTKITDEWQKGSSVDKDLMERCKQRFDSLRVFEMYLYDVLKNGENAKRELLELDKHGLLKRAIKR